MLTSVDKTEDGKVFSSLGIQSHLTKPARSSLLLETIIEVLAEKHAKASDADEASRGILMAQQIANLPDRDEGDGEVQADELSSQDVLTPQPQAKETPALLVDTGEPAEVSPQMPEAPALDETRPSANDTIDVLVCEDNEVNQIVFTQILQSGGYSFTIANDGVAGVEAYKKHAPSLVLMDVSMPNMNGLEATAEIRRQDAMLGKHTPIIGVTAHAIKGDMESCLEAGMDDYLSKPVSPDKLQEKISVYLSATPVPDSLAS